MGLPRTAWAVALLALCALLFLVVAAGLADEASARTIQVPEDQATVMKAVNSAIEGDTILVSSGYYEENIQISKRLILKGTYQHSAVLSNPGYPAVVMITSPSVTLINFKIEGRSDQSGVYVDEVGDVTLDGLLIVDCDKGIFAKNGNDLVVKGCTIKKSVSTGLKVVGEGDYYEHIAVSDTILEGNGDNGAWLISCKFVDMNGLTARTNSGNGISANNVLEAHLRNCTLNGNWNGLMLASSNGWTVEESVFQNNMENGIEMDQSGKISSNVLRRNLITDNSQATTTSAAGILFNGESASGNLVESNIIRYNPIGINFVSPSGGCGKNTFRENRISLCNYAIWENSGTGPNEYLLNDFVDNSVVVAAVHVYTTFDDGELGNYWSDYTTKYPMASRTGPVWSQAYKVKVGVAVFDHYPLAYRYEQDPPVIDALLLLDDETLVPGYPATFGADAHDASAITGYRWTVLPAKGLESSYTTTSYIFTFTFNKVGIHWLTVEVTDVWGISASLAEQFNVEDTVPPVAEAGPDITVGLGSTVTLDGSASTDNHGIASISWVFDPDGLNLRFGSSYATFTMNKLGSYQAILFVVDHAGNAATDRVYINVKDLTPPHAVVGSDASISLGDKHTFDGTSSTDNVGIVLWRWTVNTNGNLLATVADPVFDFTFTELGRYEVTLTVGDAAGNDDKDSLNIIVVDNEPPVAEAGRDQEVLMGTEVNFDAAASTDDVGIIEYEWTFRYGPKVQYLHGIRVSWQFDVPGEYLVSLVVLDDAGNHDTDVMRVQVVDTDPPIARFWASENVKVGQTAIFDASGSEDNVGIKVVEWRVDHGGTTNVLRGTMAQFPINDPGTYKVTLAIRDAAGNEATEDWSFYVAPKASEADAPSWLVPGMVAVLAAAMLVGYVYARRRYMS